MEKTGRTRKEIDPWRKRKPAMTERDYTVQVLRSRRKTVSIQIKGPSLVLVRAPLYTPQAELRRIIEENRPWIESHLEKAARQEETARQEALSPQEIDELANQALAWFPPRVRIFADQIGVRVGRTTIRNQKTRWGSCSAQGNLNFNCLLMLCPPEIRDYVIVHELCHRLEMNHSPRFWAAVEKVLPDYRQRRKWLKTEGQAILARMTAG